MRILHFTIVPTTGDEEISVKDIDVSEDPLEPVRQLIDGYVRPISFDGFFALVNDDGGPLGLTRNISASLFLASHKWKWGPLVGSIVLIGKADDESFCDVPEWLIESVASLFPMQFKKED